MYLSLIPLSTFAARTNAVAGLIFAATIILLVLSIALAYFTGYYAPLSFNIHIVCIVWLHM